MPFLLSEWHHIVDAWHLESWDQYREVSRLGRKTRLSEAQRAGLWAIFAKVREELMRRKLVTPAGMFTRLANHWRHHGARPYDFVVVAAREGMRMGGSEAPRGLKPALQVSVIGHRAPGSRSSW